MPFDFAQGERIQGIGPAMIDNFALGLSHGLMLLAAWLLFRRPDLDHEPGPRDEAPQGSGATPRA